MTQIEYIHLPPMNTQPSLELTKPFAAVVIIDAHVSDDWRNLISTWLVDAGCLYMMAWGHDCSLWDDSVDWVNIEKFNFGIIPDHKFIMTTWHNDELLKDVFHYAFFAADHPTVELKKYSPLGYY